MATPSVHGVDTAPESPETPNRPPGGSPLPTYLPAAGRSVGVSEDSHGACSRTPGASLLTPEMEQTDACLSVTAGCLRPPVQGRIVAAARSRLGVGVSAAKPSRAKKRSGHCCPQTPSTLSRVNRHHGSSRAYHHRDHRVHTRSDPSGHICADRERLVSAGRAIAANTAGSRLRCAVSPSWPARWHNPECPYGRRLLG
jgi:hypothetical protein